MGVWGNCPLPPILWRSKMKEAIKSKKGIMAIVSILNALLAAIWQNGGLDGIIITNKLQSYLCSYNISEHSLNSILKGNLRNIR